MILEYDGKNAIYPEQLNCIVKNLLVHNHRHQFHDLISLVDNDVACACRTEGFCTLSDY